MTDSIHAAPRPRDAELIPRAMTRAVMALVFCVLALVTIARLTGQPVSALAPTGDIVSERSVLLGGDLSGAATVQSPDGTVIAELSPEAGGFIAGVSRVIQRERTKHRVPAEGPVTLRQHESGRISIKDPATGWSADLMGFGEDNARAFARLLAQ
ncbi:photosynthetic complex assembly protein PuhC [Sulfitobacter sp. D35]|uniref:photosynthetic complex assembly protein PuhC n=1 Tax=Sulfitobacter sp. D35 TaxID=3083252 RepID=UPI00296E3A98|nr:photosynthetic complex assembly protein PuhC [Sulfitobacter sp. D35]MDW4499404.1 photosynthetic complex assembly protein PuhC [Sulfitobacter sp. D35]